MAKGWEMNKNTISVIAFGIVTLIQGLYEQSQLRAGDKVVGDGPKSGKQYAEMIEKDLDDYDVMRRPVTTKHLDREVGAKVESRLKILDELNRAAEQEFKDNKRDIDSLLAIVAKHHAAALDAAETAAQRVAVQRDYLESQKKLEDYVERRNAAQPERLTMRLAVQAARVEAEIQLREELRRQKSEAQMVEQLTARVNMLRLGVKATLANHEVGVKGGDAKYLAKIARVWWVARADLAVAQGDVQAAADALRRAAEYAKWSGEIANSDQFDEDYLPANVTRIKAEEPALKARLFQLAPEDN
jgi:hypothetical protein